MLDVNLLQIEELYNKVQQKYNSKQPFVIYKKPNDKQVTGYFQNSDKLQLLSNFTQRGFIFAPFKSEAKKVIFLIDACEIVSSSLENKWYKEIDRFVNYGEKEIHKSIVTKAIHFIKNNEAEKIVISRKEIISTSAFNFIETFKKLLCFYPKAMVYCWYHPKVGLWLGATPEKLLTISENSLYTMSLASTRPFNGSFTVKWNAKEKQEQQIVTNYILEVLQSISKTVCAEEPTTIKAGNLLHLQSKIKAELHEDFNLEKVLGVLHPTPAVAGFPKQKAIRFILDNENYDREYYSGYFGELNVEKTTNLYVNLRCMKYKDNSVAIYVGGGITKDSNSEKEWQETVEKTKTIKKALTFN